MHSMVMLVFGCFSGMSLSGQLVANNSIVLLQSIGEVDAGALYNWQDCLLNRCWPSWRVVLPWWKDGPYYGCKWAILSKQRCYVNSPEPKAQPGFVRDVLRNLLLWNTRPKQCDPDHVCESISYREWRWVFVFQFVDRCGYTVYISIMCAPHITIHNSPQNLVSLWWSFPKHLQMEYTLIVCSIKPLS